MPLRLADISFAYAADAASPTRALDGVSLEVAQGELVLVLGATGSGKSTLLRLAAGLLTPDCGTAEIDGRSLSTSSVRGVVGLMFQDAESQLFADTVLDDVAFGPRNLGAGEHEARERATEALASVGLDVESFGRRSPFALSGGEARRAAAAGVLAMRPRYLLADEPTAGLDLRGRREMRRVVAGARSSAGVVVVSHSAEEFLDVADRVLLLAGGRAAWQGGPAELIARPDLFDLAGLRAPDLLQVQSCARERGLDLAEFALDPKAVAARILEARASR